MKTVIETDEKELKDLCIRCNRETGYSKSDSIDGRIGYIKGEGQLCKKCGGEIILDEDPRA